MMVMVAHGVSFTAPKLIGFESHSFSNSNNTVTFTFMQNRKRNNNLCCRCTPSSNLNNWDWNQWTCHFSQIQKTESSVTLLKFHLRLAIAKEDYREAARLKKAVDEATSDDAVAQIMSDFKSCVDDERYYDASRLCAQSGSGLVGWWVGYSDSDDSLGRIIHITPGMGRFVARIYAPRQLLKGSPGTPIFEIYVVKNADDTYQMQVVHLQRAKRNSTSSPQSKAEKSPTKPEVENESSVEVQEHEEKVDKNDELYNSIYEATEQGIRSVLNFLKDNTPEAQIKFMNTYLEEEGAEDVDFITLPHEDSNITTSSENTVEEVKNLDGEGTLEADSDASTEKKVSDGGVVSTDNETLITDGFIRLPAEIQDTKRNNFVLHIPARNVDDDSKKNKLHEIYEAALAAQGFSDLMSSEDVKEFFGSKGIYKVSRFAREMAIYAINKAQKRSSLSEYTSFSRITNPSDNSDPFDGLYVGSFDAYDSELVQLKRKFGCWSDVDNENSPSDTELFEYVECVKLTDDFLVPAGEVVFRAKIGKAVHNIKFSNVLGVDKIYKGQAKVVEIGCKNRRWIDGELLMFNGKGHLPNVKDGTMGFRYGFSGRSFVMYLNRLRLPQ